MAKRNLKNLIRKAAGPLIGPPAELANMPIARALWKENIKKVGAGDMDELLEYCILGEQIASLKKLQEAISLQFTILERRMKAKNIIFDPEKME
jgi:hypothetical protein